MTLIPAFACDGGFVIHADSEENCGDFRRSVQKIIPQDMGRLRVIVAGSGIGVLIDSFTAKLKERLDSDSAADIQDVKRLMERRLPNFYSTDVANYPCADAEKLHKFIVAAFSPVDGKFAVWAAPYTTLIPVTSYELAGVEDKIYDHFAQRLYRPDMTFPQAILAGLYLLTVAEATSSFVRAPYQVAVVSSAGIELEEAHKVKALTERLAAYQKHVDALFLQCSDVSICLPDFEDLVEDFKKTASALHREHLDQRAAEMSIAELLTFDANPLRPIGHFTYNAEGKFSAIHDREEIAKLRHDFRDSKEFYEAMKNNFIVGQGQSHRLMACKTQSCDAGTFAGKLIRAENGTPIAVEGACPKCHQFQRQEFTQSSSQTSEQAR